MAYSAPRHEDVKFLAPPDMSGSFPNCNHCNELLLSYTVSCELLNNCSEHGACTGPNECTCEKGYQGANCSEGIENCSMKNFVAIRAEVMAVSLGEQMVTRGMGNNFTHVLSFFPSLKTQVELFHFSTSIPSF